MRVAVEIKANSTVVIVTAALSIIFIWLYYPVMSGMVSEWYNNPNHSHGFIIPVVAGYFIWRRRKYIKNITLKSTNWGILIVLGGLIMYILGHLGAAFTMMRVSMLVVLAGTILFIYGKELLKELYFPFFYLFFMIPMPDYLYDTIAFPLKLIVTKYSVLSMKLMGIPVLREGNIIMLTNITLQVVDACSGIRSLTSLLAIGVAFAHVSQRNKFRKIILVLTAIPIAIIANIARVVITGVLAKSYGSSVAEGFFHEFAGLAVFAVEIVLLVGIGVIMSRAVNKPQSNAKREKK